MAALWTCPSTASAINAMMWSALSWLGSRRRGKAMKAVTAFARAISGGISSSSCPAGPGVGSRTGFTAPEAFASLWPPLLAAPVSSISPAPSVGITRERFRPEAKAAAAKDGRHAKVLGLGSAANAVEELLVVRKLLFQDFRLDGFLYKAPGVGFTD